MPCQYCKQSTHTLLSCQEIIPVVESHRRKIDIEFNSFRSYRRFTEWLAEIPVPVLKYLVKTYKGKMSQPRVALEKVIIDKLYLTVHQHLLVHKKRIGGVMRIDNILDSVDRYFSCLLRFINLLKKKSSPSTFWKLCKTTLTSIHDVSVLINSENAQLLIHALDLTQKQDVFEKHIFSLRTYIEQYREIRKKNTHEKTQWVLKRLDFNTDLFRHIVSFL